MTAYLIRYPSRGTTNGRPVGVVYVYALPGDDFGFPERYVYSYTKDPVQATKFDKDEGTDLLHKWPGAELVPENEAKVLE